MFQRVGVKIKVIAVVLFVLGSIVACIGGFIVAERNVLNGILAFAIGILLSYLNVILLYGYGQLIDNSDIIVGQLRKLEQMTSGTIPAVPSKEAMEESTRAIGNDLGKH